MLDSGMQELLEPQRSKHVSPSRLIASDPEVIEKAELVVACVEEGDLLKHALQKAGIGRAMFSSVLAGQRELAARLARAQEFSADFLVDDAIEAARNEPDVMRARVIAENNRWAASRRNSKKYGDRIDLNVTQTLDISGTLLEARQRMLRPMRDQLDIEDAQSPVNTGLLTLGANDSQSRALAEPDIFAAPVPVPVVIEQAPASDEPSIFD
jgi:hypothetical protein